MPDVSTTTAVAACPTCASPAREGDVFCPRCGVFLHDQPDGLGTVNLPIVHLLSEITTLQRELLHQFRQGQSTQARQFQRALQFQAQQLEQTLAYSTKQTESIHQRAQIWQRWAAGLAAAVFVLIIVAVQLA